MQVELFLVADYANITKDDKLNVMGVFRTVGAEEGLPIPKPTQASVSSGGNAPETKTWVIQQDPKIARDEVRQEGVIVYA